MPTILDEIVASRRRWLENQKALVPEAELRRRAADAPPPRDFLAALAAAPPIRLIAEVKKASPSKGLIRPQCDPAEVARTYEQHGASCISVLTEEQYFQGSFDNLRMVRAAVRLPVLCKDFVVEQYQVYQARAAGADAVLLIAECLDDAQLARLYELILSEGMTPLVELHDERNVDRVLRLGAQLIGVNNRNLQTFAVDLHHTLRLRQRIPPDRALVAESGIRCRADVVLLESAGVQAMLVGETLMASPDIGAAVDVLLGKQPVSHK